MKKSLRLRGKLLLGYTLGGLLPMLFVVAFLVQGQRQNIIALTKSTASREVSLLESDLSAKCGVVSDVSRRLYFDPALESIASTQFGSYEALVQAYRSYTALDSYVDYYSREIEDIRIYIDNDTLSASSRIIRADDAIQAADWYQQALADQGQARWWLLLNSEGTVRQLTLVRLIRTSEGKAVGVAAIAVNTQNFYDQFSQQSADTYLLLDGQLVAQSGAGTADETALAALAGQDAGSAEAEYGGARSLVTTGAVGGADAINRLSIVRVEPYAEILAYVNQSLYRTMWYIAASVAFSLGMIFAFSLHFSRRVERFKGEMGKAAQGKTELASEIGGHDEIAELYAYLNQMVQDIQRLTATVYQNRLEQEQMKSRQHQAEFKMLASQINPHFLFNTLETIRMKAHVCGAAEVEDMVKMLARIMRRNIEVQDTVVPLKNELQLTEYYLKIQRYRFGDNFTYTLDADFDLSEYRILPLLIQPIVENAFVHGLEHSRCGGAIRITVRRGAQLTLQVQDDGAGIPAPKLAELRASLGDPGQMDRTHIGLANVNQRIQLFYGAEYGLTLESEEGRGTTVTLRLPIENGENTENGEVLPAADGAARKGGETV